VTFESAKENQLKSDAFECLKLFNYLVVFVKSLFILNLSVANVRSYISQNFRKQIKIDELAEIAGLSLSQFQRRFRQIYDCSPVKMVQKLRVEEASKLLQHSDADLNEIAESLGYKSASFFSTQFKQMNGLSPREHRKKFA
jgi:transcriptional regulator GlxA family with amidase domain